MLRRTRINNNVVVTLLSSSPALSRRAQSALQSVMHVEPVSGDAKRGTDDDGDDLNALFQTPLFGNTRWESLVSNEPASGTIVHFLSIEGSVENRDKEELSVLSLVHEQHGSCSVATSIQNSRTLLAEHMKSSTARNGSLVAPSSMMRIAMKRALGRPLTAFDLLGFGGGLPLLKFEQASDDSTQQQPQGDETRARFFKEVGIPHFDDASYPDGRTLLSTLSEASLHRPAVGIYQFRDKHANGGLAVRPLPSAKEDRVLPHPSLVFYNNNKGNLGASDDGDDDETTTATLRNGCRIAKIGFSSSRRGHYMLSHADLPGLDLRLTDTESFSSHFPEAQQALLASSLPDLQSDNVLLEGGNRNKSNMDNSLDAMNGLGDCWVEFRANMKQPSGFLKKRNKTAPRVAKIPDIPFE